MPEDSTQNLNDPLDTKPLIEQLAREMVATREMLLARFDRVEDRLSAMESEIVTLNQQAKETNVRLAEMNERFGAIAEDQLTMRGKQKYFEKKLLEIEEDRQPH